MKEDAIQQLIEINGRDDLNDEQKKDARARILNEFGIKGRALVRQYLKEARSRGKPIGSRTVVGDTEESQVQRAFMGILRAQLSNLQVNGKPISDVTYEEFAQVTESDISVQGSVTNTTVTNAMSSLSKLGEKTKEGLEAFKRIKASLTTTARRKEAISFTAMLDPFNDYLRPSGTLTTSARSKIYADFKQLNDEFSKLEDAIKKVGGDEEITNKLVGLVDDINYFVEFEEAQLENVFDVGGVAKNMATALLNQINFSASVFMTAAEETEEQVQDDDDPEDAGIGDEDTEGEAAGPETSQLGSGSFQDRNSLLMDYPAEDVFEENAEDIVEAISARLDPLSIIALENANRELTVVGNFSTEGEFKEDEIADVKSSISESVRIDFVGKILASIEDKADARQAAKKFERYLSQLESKIDVLDESVTGSVILPIYFADLPSLSPYYGKVRKDSRGYVGIKQRVDDDKIKDFLDLVLELIYSETPQGAISQRRQVTSGGSSAMGSKTQYGVEDYVSDDIQERTSRSPQDVKLVRPARPKGQFAENINEEKARELLELVAKLFFEVDDVASNIGVSYPFIGHRLAMTDGGSSNAALLASNARKKNNRLITKANLEKITLFLDRLKSVGERVDFSDLESSASGFYNAMLSVYGIKDKNSPKAKEFAKQIASLLGAFTKTDVGSGFRFRGIDVAEANRELGTNNPNQLSVLTSLVKLLNNEKSVVGGTSAIKNLTATLNSFNIIAKEDINMKLLDAHDSIRLLKKQEVYHSYLSYESIEDICKMQDYLEENYLDLTALEITNIVKSVDSHKSIGSEYGIPANTVYVIKSHFR